jgi:hypothetical protein
VNATVSNCSPMPGCAQPVRAAADLMSIRHQAGLPVRLRPWRKTCAARILDWVGYLHCLSARWVQWWLACGVLLKIAYLPTCRMLGLAEVPPGFRTGIQ